MPPNLADRDLRQRDLLPPEALAAVHATVIGVGAIGRQVALQLAAIGVPRLQLIDPDTIEPVNLAPQGYFESDLGHTKVGATAGLCRRLNSAITLTTRTERFRRTHDVGNCAFCCVDVIATRRHIWGAVKRSVAFFVDARMSGEAIRVLSVADDTSGGREHYPTTLFAAAEAHAGACTARSTIFTANIAAGLMVEQFSRYLRRVPVDADLQLNLFTSELTVTEAAAS